MMDKIRFTRKEQGKFLSRMRNLRDRATMVARRHSLDVRNTSDLGRYCNVARIAHAWDQAWANANHHWNRT